MSILEKMGMALDSRDEAGLNDCLHDDCKFTLHAAGKILSKSEVVSWGMSGDVNRKKVRILFENEENIIISYKKRSYLNKWNPSGSNKGKENENIYFTKNFTYNPSFIGFKSHTNGDF